MAAVSIVTEIIGEGKFEGSESVIEDHVVATTTHIQEESIPMDSMIQSTTIKKTQFITQGEIREKRKPN